MSKLLLKTITYNIGQGGGHDDRVTNELIRLMVVHEPHAIMVQEAHDRTNELRAACKKTGYICIRPDNPNGKGAKAVAVLLRPDVVLKSQKSTFLTPRTFVGKKVAGAMDDGFAQAKYITWARIIVGGRRWAVGSTHLVPSVDRAGEDYDKARALHKKQVNRCAVWYARRVVYKPVLGGDFNTTDRGKMKALLALAQLFTRASHGKRAIDHFYLSRKWHVEGEALEGFASDHRPVVMKVYANA